MDTKKERLALLKSKLQHKLKAQAFWKEQIDPYLEIFAYLKESEVPISIIDLVGIENEWLPYLQEEVLKPLYTNMLSTTGTSQITDLLNQLFTYYPSVNPLRFVPCLTQININSVSKLGLKEAINQLKLKNQWVYFYYLRYAPVLKLELFDLIALDNEQLFNFWHGDVVIFPENLSWLITHTLEEDWYAGRR